MSLDIEQSEKVDKAFAIEETRKAARHFAMLYFNFCKTLVESLGLEQAKPLIKKAVFSLSLDRTDRLCSVAKQQGLEPTLETFQKITDLPQSAWVPELGHNHCPYAQAWKEYFDDYPWFKEVAPMYCDVIDTTNIENFSKKLSHKITKNVLWGDDTCTRIYFVSEDVEKGKLTYSD